MKLLPTFSNLELSDYPARLKVLLDHHLQQIETLLQATVFTWENLMHPLETMENELTRFFSPIAHLHAVVNTPELRNCYEACLPPLSAYESAIGHNEALYHAITSISTTSLSNTQQNIIKDTLRDFKLSGVALSPKHKKRFEAIQARLSVLTTLFEHHLLDATAAFQYSVTDETLLEGLPPHAKETARALAEKNNQPGYILTLETPCYLAVMTYAHNRDLREKMYHAYVTRASELGPTKGLYDNTNVIEEILALRHEEALLLDYKNYAEVSIATKMVDHTEQVLAFLNELTTRVHGKGQEEYAELLAFAQKHMSMTSISPWDVAYLSEKKQQQELAISQEALRSYFPLPQVMQGFLDIVHRLFNIRLETVPTADVWHETVTCYAVYNSAHQLCGFIYIDWFARPQKRNGAWMDSLQARFRRADGTLQHPIATLTCNFAQTDHLKPAQLSHDEVLTLFHEFGHCLHHVLTDVDYLSAAGTQGVAWDAVELPSQLFENWCWEEETLDLISVNLPRECIQSLQKSRHFQTGLALLRQLLFSLFDFRLHLEYNPKTPHATQALLDEIRKTHEIIKSSPDNRFQHAFSHIFAGGYAAGYYSYLWAEVLSSDAFSRFEQEGLLNQETGMDFLHKILSVGGSIKAAAAFQNFMGRAPTMTAFLKHRGIN